MKTLEQITEELRRQHPTWSASKLKQEASAAFVKQQSTANKPTINWNEPTDGENGVLIGFGLDDRVIPIKVSDYIVNLIKNNPTAYGRIKNAVKQVTGRTINDPVTLGSWVGRLATNMAGDEDVAKNVTIESFLRAAGSAAGAATPKPELSRSVYQYSPEQIDNDINSFLVKRAGRTLTNEDKGAGWYQDLTNALGKMMAEGTITTTKLVKNKETGKLEQVTTQTPMYTPEKGAAAIEAAVLEADPAAVERKKNLEFANWAFKKMAGGQ